MSRELGSASTSGNRVSAARFRRAHGFATVVLMLAGAAYGYGCGMSLTQPVNRFPDVNDQGFISYWRHVGEIDLGDGKVLPLLLNFRSNMPQASAFLGDHWHIPALEARIDPIGPGEFMMTEPDGWRLTFRCAKPGDSVWYGSGGWLAEVKGDEVQAWAPCGWRLTFKGGRIAEIGTPAGRSIVYDYADGRLRSIRRDGAELVAIKPAGEAGWEIQTAGRVITLGRTLQGGQSAWYVRSADERIDVERAAAEPGGAGLAVRDGNGTHHIEWDASTLAARKSGTTRFNVTKSGNGLRIETYRNGVISEVWERDPSRGYELVGTSDGKATETRRFIHGPSAGRTSSIRRIDEAGRKVAVYEAIIDARGEVVGERRMLAGQVFDTSVQRSPSGDRISNASVAIVARHGLISLAPSSTDAGQVSGVK